MRVAMGGQIRAHRSRYYWGPHFTWISPCGGLELEFSPPQKRKRLLPPPFFRGEVRVVGAASGEG